MATVNLQEKSDPYVDLEIQCDGISFYVHRVYVCPKSKVLAKECEKGVKEADITRVEHKTFDASTLGRMLLFLETGDYVFTATSEDTAITELVVTSKATAPHLSNMAMKVATTKPTSAGLDSGLLLIHVNTYHIARYYEIPDLQALTLAEFRNSDAVMTSGEFLYIANIVYANSRSDDPLRQELVIKLVNKHPEWLMERHFRQSLAEVEHHAFMVDVWSASFDKLTEHEAIMKTDVEAQHEANLQLHSALEQGFASQTKTNSNLQALERKLKDSETIKADLEAKLRRHDIWFMENSEKVQMNEKELQERDKLLEEKERLLQEEKQRADACGKLVLSKNEEIKEKLLKIQELMDKANKSHTTCLEKDVEIADYGLKIVQKDKKIVEETARADKYYKVCQEKDKELVKVTKERSDYFDRCAKKGYIIKAKEDELANYKAQYPIDQKKVKFFSQAQDLINDSEECDNCGDPCWPFLSESQRGNVYVRCRSCDHVEVHWDR